MSRPEPGLALGVDTTGSGLVEHEVSAALGQGAGDEDPAPPPARQRVETVVAAVPELDRAQRLLHGVARRERRKRPLGPQSAEATTSRTDVGTAPADSRRCGT